MRDESPSRTPGLATTGGSPSSGIPRLTTAKSDSSTTKSESTPKVVISLSREAGPDGDRQLARGFPGLRSSARSVVLARLDRVFGLAAIASNNAVHGRPEIGFEPGPTGPVERFGPARTGPARSPGRPGETAMLVGRSAWSRTKPREVIYRAATIGRPLSSGARGVTATLAGMPPERSGRIPPPPSLPRRGRHDLGLARIALRRVAVGGPARAVSVERTSARLERRREQLPLPLGFVDRRQPRG